jgi:uncharacterized membrane protein
MKRFILLVAVLFLVSCASKPQLYPNQKLDSVTKEQADNDIKDCTEKADQFAKSSKGKQILKGAGGGSVIGAVTGAAFGLFTGNVVRGATQGAVVGGAAGAAGGAITPDQLKHRFVEQCLANKGYQVIGWD